MLAKTFEDKGYINTCICKDEEDAIIWKRRIVNWFDGLLSLKNVRHSYNEYGNYNEETYIYENYLETLLRPEDYSKIKYSMMW